MRIDLNCPVEVWRTALQEKNVCVVTLYNLTQQVVTSAEMTVICRDDQGEELARVVHRGHDLADQPGKTCRTALYLPDGVEPVSFDVTIEKVWYEGGAVWRRPRGPQTEYTSNALPHSRELEQLRYLAGETAVGFPEVQGPVWLCVCGRPNSLSDETCIRCGKHRDEVFGRFSREAVAEAIRQHEELKDEEARAVREESSRRQAEREKDFVVRKRRSRRVLALVIALIVCLIGAYGTVFHLLPYRRYVAAQEALAAGQYAEAIEALTEMGDYKDAPAFLKKAQYGAALEDLNSGEERRIRAAREVFAAMADDADSAEQVKAADYALADLTLSKGDLAGARAAFAALGDYAASAERVLHCDYQLAKQELEQGHFESARAAFEALGDYSDAPALVLECRYRTVERVLEDGDYETALELLDELSDTEEKQELVRHAHYVKAQALSAEGEALAAGDEYLLAGSYADAAFQAINCIYAPAVEAMEAGDWYTAANLLAKIPGYEDVDERLRTCLYQQAVQAVKDTEYIRAASLLDQLPEDYEGAAALRQACVYGPAAAAMNSGDYRAAVAGFEQLGSYEDSEKQLRKARYKLAGQLASEGTIASLTEAAALYEQLGNYVESAAQLKVVRYQLAQLYMDAGEYEQAAELYTALRTYRQSADKLKAAQYAQAQQLMAGGNWTAAKPILEELGKYEQARTLVKACDYAAAAELAEKGDLAAAAEAFETLGDYEDAAAQAKTLRYRMAQAQADGGDLQGAAEAFEAMGDYEDAAAQAKTLRYRMAQAQADGGDLQGAAEAFEALGDYEDAAAQAKTLRYRMAQAQAASGDLTGAAQAFEALGDHEDAAAQAKAMWYAAAQETAVQDAAEAIRLYQLAGDHPGAAEAIIQMEEEAYAEPARRVGAAATDAERAYLLSQMDLAHVPERFADLPETYRAACYAEGKRLLAEGQEDKAYPYLQRCEGYLDADTLMNVTAWRILGTWSDGQQELTFRPNGTCVLGGEELNYTLDGYNIATAKPGEEPTVTLKLSSVQKERMTLRNMAAGGQVLNLTRTAAPELLPLPEAAAPAPAAEASAEPAEEASPAPAEAIPQLEELK